MLAAVAAIGFAVSAYAWQPPTVTAPAGNVDAPLNTGPAMQVKSGPIGTLDNILGFFGSLAKLQRLNVGIGCPTYCVGQATDIFNAWFTNPNVKGGFALHNDGKIQILDGTSWTTTPGYVLTADDVNGTVRWASAPSNDCPPGQIKVGSTCVNKAQDLPAGQNNHTLRFNGTTQLWEDSGVLQNNTNYVTVARPASSTDSNNLAIYMENGETTPSVGGRTALTANVSSANETANRYAAFKTDAKGFDLRNWGDTDYVDLGAKRGQFTGGLAAPKANFGGCNNAFFPLLACYSTNQANVFTATADSTISPNISLFGNTTPRGIIVDNTGSLIIHDWTTLTPPAGLAGKVLTADANGAATWQPSSLPPAGPAGTVLTSTGNGTSWLPGLPAGTLNHTLRYDGTKWVDAGNLQNDAAKVSVINNEFNSGKFTGTTLNEGLKVKSDGTISAGIFNAQNNLTAGFGSAPSQGVFQVGSFGLGILGRGFQVVQPPAGPSGIGLAGSKGVPLGADVSGLQGVDGENALFLTGHTMGGAAPSVSIVTNSKNLTLWNRIENKWANLTAGNGTFNGIVKINKQNDQNAWVSPLTINLTALPGNDSRGRDALNVQVNSANVSDNQPAYLTTNANGFGLWSTLKNSFGDFRAGVGTFGDAKDQLALHSVGTVQIEGGNPNQGKVLVSNDNQGNAEWGDVITEKIPANIDRIVVRKDCLGVYPSGQGLTPGNQTFAATETQAGWACEGYGDFHPGPLIGDTPDYSDGLHARIWCPIGYIMTGGGGDCEHDPEGNHGFISQPTNDGGWSVMCEHGADHSDAHVSAVCVKTNAISDVNVRIASTGGKQWHPAGDLKSGKAPNELANTCNAAYNSPQYGSHTFLNNPPQVGYIHQKWEGFFYPVGTTPPPNTPPVHKLSGPGLDGPAGYTGGPGPLNASDIIIGSGCVTRNDNAAGGNYGQNYTNLPSTSDGSIYWQDKVVDAPDLGGGSNYYGTQDIWYTYLYY